MPSWMKPGPYTKWHAVEAGTPGTIMRAFCGILGGNIHGWVEGIVENPKNTKCKRCKAILKSRRREERENEDLGSRVY